jgi:putative membrane-bound dehydrogenase-like protein
MLAAFAFAALPQAETIRFERQQLSTDFLCEGATFADLDRDGKNDVVAGPWWYEGPEFKTKHAIYPPKPFDPHGYSDNFFVWPRDLDGDGWIDLLVVGFPGKEAFWYRNPLADPSKRDTPWERFLVAPSVDNESPTYVDVNRDGVPDLVFQADGRFGWATPVPGDPRKPWTFHPISEKQDIGRFTHGLGVGDLNGDGRADVLWKDGWYEQPASLAGDPVWNFHPYRFSDREGGAQMLVTDVDGDGDADVITSLAAHHFGLSWFEQVKKDGEITFIEHRLMDDDPSKSPHKTCFAELHALDLADVDGDGVPDLVTGKRWWAHGPDGDPQPGSKPEVWWFRIVRGAKGEVDFVPHLADDGSGVGTFLTTGDVDGDGLKDVVIGNKLGAFVLFQRRGDAPRPIRDPHPVPAEKPAGKPPEKPGGKSGVFSNFGFETGDLTGWTATGDAFEGQPIRGDTVSARGREPSLHEGEFWIGGYEKLGDNRKGTLTSDPFVVSKPWASFLVGGGAYLQTRVEIVRADDGRAIFQSSGANFESLQRVAVDLSSHVGESIRIRIVDDATGGWGHVNFDDFRFHDSKPSIERPPGVPPIQAIDEVAYAGLSPAEAQRAMKVPDGFQVDLVAAEPEIHQPIAMTFDDKGRLWVAEAFTYPQRQPGDEGKDDIVVFEDQDGDGRFEKRTVFLEHLNLVSGLEVGFGGVWIGAAPYLLFVPDRNGDLVPDGPPERVLDGFGYEDTHETLNAFAWGPDGWLYGCHGVFTHSRVGAPGTPDEQRVPLNAGLWRFHPTRREFEVFAWGTSNPWGVDWDEHGQAILTACVVPHLWHVVQGGRYERQAGNHFDKYVFEDIGTIADHLHWKGVDQWAANLHSNALGGGHAHCGALVYQGGAFPEKWRGAVLMNNIHGNRTNCDLLERKGSSFVAHHGEDFLLANDRWFRGVALKCGPDGAVYVSDWYDKQACHLSNPEVWDRSNGRIWRVSYGPRKPLKVDLAKLPSTDLVGLEKCPNEWTARHARRLLQERGPDPATRTALRRMIDREESEPLRLRALWSLAAIDGLGTDLPTLLGDRHEYVQAWAVQLLLEKKEIAQADLAELERLAASTQSPVVRLYLAAGLQRIPVASRWGIAESLLARGEDASDPSLPKMIWYGVEPLAAADPDRALALAGGARIEKVARFLARREAADPAVRDAVARALASPAFAPMRELLLEETAVALRDERNLRPSEAWSSALRGLVQDPDAAVSESARRVALLLGDSSGFPPLRRVLADAGADAGARREALDVLVRAKDAAALPAILGLLDEPSFRGPSLRALASYEDPRIAGEILARYPSLAADEKRDALNTLSSRAASAGRLLDAVAAGSIPRNEIGAFVVREIESLGDAKVAARVGDVWGRVRATPDEKKKRIAEIRAMVEASGAPPPDRARGREVFSRTCEQCHTLFGTGGKVGPDLTGSNRADLDYLLSNVVDPNAVVGKDYLATMVWLKDGRLVTGIQKSSTDTSITLQSENELAVIAKDDIEESKLSDLSTMPEGLLDAMKEDEIRDLVGYLRGKEQAPILATRSNLDRFFDGKSLAGWSGDRACWSVENGEIVGRTKGLERNTFLVSSLELEDFRLSLEVRLAKDEGNSGVQFRTRARDDGEVEGYQADVGPGWWGKLYEENGRGVLADGPKEDPVVKDGWNRYEIEAKGHHVKTWLNGKACVDLEDPQGATRGIVALQLHSGGATEVRFRNLRLGPVE